MPTIEFKITNKSWLILFSTNHNSPRERVMVQVVTPTKLKNHPPQ